MAIHVQDEETDWLVREFAKRRGLGLTAAIKTAVREASKLDETQVDAFMADIKPVLDRARARKAQNGNKPVDDKRFMDEMWGEDV
jgi:antitoxin VapB